MLSLSKPAARRARWVDAGHFAVGAAGHAVVVVDQAVDDRQPELRFSQRSVELILARPVQRLEDDAVRIGAVARERADHAALHVVVDAAGHGRAGRDRNAAADDRVRAEVADAEVRDVHAASAPLAVAVLFAEQLGDGAEDMVLHDRFPQLFAGEAREFGAALAELLFGHLLDRVEALRNRVAVAAVRARDKVGDVQHRADARCGRLLPDGEVGRPAVIVIADDFVCAGAALVDHVFEFTDHEHRFVEVGDFGFRDLLRLELVGQRLRERVGRNRLELDGFFTEAGTAIGEIVVRHFAFPYLLTRFMPE